MQSVLNDLIEESSKPLTIIEHDFATDSTGIKTKLFSTWFGLRCKKRIRKKDNISIHITTGIKSNIVTALNVETKQGKDNVIFGEHVNKTKNNFKNHKTFGFCIGFVRTGRNRTALNFSLKPQDFLNVKNFYRF